MGRGVQRPRPNFARYLDRHANRHGCVCGDWNQLGKCRNGALAFGTVSMWCETSILRSVSTVASGLRGSQTSSWSLANWPARRRLGVQHWALWKRSSTAIASDGRHWHDVDASCSKIHVIACPMSGVTAESVFISCRYCSLKFRWQLRGNLPLQ